MFYRSSLTLLISLFLFQNQIFALEHYCQNPSTVGRAIYVCEASADVEQSLTAVRSAMPKLKAIRTQDIKKACRKQCKEECQQKEDGDNIAAEENDGDKRQCFYDCRSTCFGDSLESASTAVAAGMSIYKEQCNLSLVDSEPCEQLEARKYCKERRVKRVERNLPPKNARELARLKKAYRTVIRSFKVRRTDLKEENRVLSENIKNDVNNRLECKVIPDGTSVCSLEDIQNENRTQLIDEYSALLSLQYEDQKPLECEAPDPCGTLPPRDVVIILDSTTSVNNSEWEQLIKFVKKVVRTLNVNDQPNGDRYAILEFANTLNLSLTDSIEDERLNFLAGSLDGLSSDRTEIRSIEVEDRKLFERTYDGLGPAILRAQDYLDLVGRIGSQKEIWAVHDMSCCGFPQNGEKGTQFDDAESVKLRGTTLVGIRTLQSSPESDEIASPGLAFDLGQDPSTVTKRVVKEIAELVEDQFCSE